MNLLRLKSLLAVSAVALLLLWSASAYAWTTTYSWTSVPNASAYKIEKSVDNGATWTVVTATLTTPTFNYTGTETGLTLFRFSNCNSTGCTVRPADGHFHNEAWQPPTAPVNLGVQ